jgi:hypothetical protein
MTDNFEKIRSAMGLPNNLEGNGTGFATKPAAPDQGVTFKPKAEGTIVRPTEMPSQMAMKIGISDNKLTLEFEKECAWMQFDKASAWKFIQALTGYARTIT